IEGRCAGDCSGVELRAGTVESERAGSARAEIQDAVDDAADVEGAGIGEITHHAAAVNYAAAEIRECARRTAEEDAKPCCAVDAAEGAFGASGTPGDGAAVGEGAPS